LRADFVVLAFGYPVCTHDGSGLRQALRTRASIVRCGARARDSVRGPLLLLFRLLDFFLGASILCHVFDPSLQDDYNRYFTSLMIIWWGWCPIFVPRCLATAPSRHNASPTPPFIGEASPLPCSTRAATGVSSTTARPAPTCSCHFSAAPTASLLRNTRTWAFSNSSVLCVRSAAIGSSLGLRFGGAAGAGLRISISMMRRSLDPTFSLTCIGPPTLHTTSPAFQ